MEQNPVRPCPTPPDRYQTLLHFGGGGSGGFDTGREDIDKGSQVRQEEGEASRQEEGEDIDDVLSSTKD